MFCMKCGKALNVDDNFCRACGRPASHIATTIKGEPRYQIPAEISS
ncbi:zinc-ribbon domain-containing protein, partial [Serratia plymuthica]